MNHFSSVHFIRVLLIRTSYDYKIPGFAASVLYLASIITKNDDNIRQKELAEAAGVTDVTIRNICRSLRRYIDLTN